jgi:hypothetical protein
MSCRLKIRYRDRAGALTALSRIAWRDRHPHVETRAYHCPACNGWHLTSQQRRRRRRR